MSSTGCVKFDELLKIESEVINNHSPEHAWCNHISDQNMAMIDFIEKYGWIMKEVFCKTCKLCDEYKKVQHSYKK